MTAGLSLTRAGLAVLAAFLAASLALAAPSALAANKPPTVSMTSPVSGATFAAPATIDITANATDPDGTIARVELYQGTTLLASRTSAPYTYTWSGVAGGSYSLTAVAFDNAGASKTSAAVTVTVTGAAITITQPVAGSTLYGLATMVSGSFAGDADSTVIVDGPFGSKLATVNAGQYSAVVPLTVGQNVVRVTVARRNRTSDTTSVTVVGNLDPLVTFTAPTSTTLDSQAPALLEADAVSPAGAIARVDFFRDGVLLGGTASPPYRYTWSAPAAGSHTLMARATDDRGVSTSVSLPVTVNGPNVAPAVALTSPPPGASFAAPAAVPLVATASDSDGSIARVDFLRDGAVVGTTNVAPYAMSLAGLGAGSYSLAARATDDRGAVTTSAPVGVVVTPPNAPPVVTLTAPANPSRLVAPAAIALAAAATDSDGSVVRVDFLANGVQVASSTAVPFAATWANVAPGSYSLAARATDNAGATATSAPVAVTVVANVPPTVALTSPTTGGGEQFAPAAFALAATAADSDGAVVRVEFLVDGSTVASVAAPPYSATWTASAPGTYSIVARAVDDAGATGTSASVSVNVSAPGLVIESPADGATVTASHVHVIGTFRAPAGSGVTVNGVIAALDGEHFYAANVPLVAGANTLQVVVTPPVGEATTRTLAVASAPAPISIDVTPTQGMAPLTVAVAVTASAEVTIAKLEVDFGTGTYAVMRSEAPWDIAVQYPAPGVNILGIRVTDTNGNAVTERVPVVALDRAAIDQRVRAVWDGMVAGLRAGDPAKALAYLDAGAQARYGPVFTTLQPQLPAIVQSFSALQGLSLTEDFGEYAINRVIDGQNRIYLIYFGLNADGVWRLGSM